jgi:DNA processing protein
MHSSWKPLGKCAYSIPFGIPNPDTLGAWLRLLAAAGHGGNRFIVALRSVGSAEALLASPRKSLRQHGLAPDEIARLKSSSGSVPSTWISWLDEPDHHLIVYGSDRYPARLAAIDDAPLALWADGSDVALLGNPQLAIVGSRNPTRNGLTIAESFADRLSQYGITVTSGLASGIDAASHRGALAGVGKTIAVLGNGIDRIYPTQHVALAAAIRTTGLIVSEYGPSTPVRAHQFPKRNRIIAGMSLGTLVVEATRRSGSLITARLANEYGREVFAVPGSIHSALSKGCHKLIRQGAKLVEQLDDILIEIAAQLEATAVEMIGSDAGFARQELPDKLAEHLDFSPITLDSLVLATGLTAAELSSMLLHLEIEGKIEALPGGRYCRLAKRA